MTLTESGPRAVGLRKARELSITGNFVDADEARRIGLVNRVVPHDHLLPFTRELVLQFTDTPAGADVLALYDQGADLGLKAALALETAHTANATWDGDAFAAAGSIAAARQRPTSR